MSEQVKTLRMLEDYFPSAKGIADHLEAVEQQLAASQAREAELRAWKESAIAVTPPLQEIARELDMPWGVSIHDKILPGVKLLKLQLNVLRECVKLYADQQMWIDLTTQQFGSMKAMHEGPEPAQAALARVEELKGSE